MGTNADILSESRINALPHPLVARFFGGSEWPVHDIGVDVPLVRIDVCGLLEVKRFSDVAALIDSHGVEHVAESFYCDYEPEAPDAK